MNENDAFFEELSRDVDADHRRIQGADGPPAHMWQTIRAQANPERTKEENVMYSTRAIEHSPVFAPRVDTRPQNGVRHTLSLAASFLVVVSVALGGWFATMQLNSPNGSNGAFGLLGQSNSEATCDVEPMTVDETLTAMERPFGIEQPEDAYPAWVIDEQRRRVLWVSESPLIPHNYVDQSLIDSFQSTSDEESFAIASERMNGFLACAQNGTVGQLFRYIRPFEIQRIVLSDLPLYRDEDAARSALETLLPQAALTLFSWNDQAFLYPEYTYSANPDISQSGTSSISGSTRFASKETIMIGITVTDQNGEIVFQNDYFGRVNPAGPLKTTERFRVIMAQSLIDNEWYVLAIIPE